MRHRLAGWLALSAAGLLGAPASASVFDAYGFGARAAAMGNAQGAAASDFTAVYYNPGALTAPARSSFGVGVALLVPRLEIDRGSAAPEAPEAVVPDTNVGISLGLLYPFGEGLLGSDRLAFGVGTYLPTVQVTRAGALDPVVPQFYRYQALPDKVIVASALALELDRRGVVSLGVGLQLLAALDGDAEIGLSLPDRRAIRRTVELDITTVRGLIAGLLVRPREDLRLGFTFRDALALRYHINTAVAVADAGRMVIDLSGVSLYTPAQYVWAAAWDPDPSWTLTADLVWSRWSQAPDPTAHFDVQLDGPLLGALEGLAAQSSDLDLGAQDTLGPRLGIEHRRAAWAFRAGYSWQPTPLPVQTGASNYVDADTQQIGLGIGRGFAEGLLSVDLAGQLSVLPRRRMSKVDAADPVGSYDSGGAIWDAMVHLRFELDR